MQNRELHYRYGISYLIFIIILIVALAYYDVPDLVDKFSFALTLSSLLLAVLAIFYTIISAHKQDSQFSKIIEASSSLSNSVKDISSASKNISILSNDIPAHFDNLGTKIDIMSQEYKVMSEQEKIADIPTGKNEIDNPEMLVRKHISHLHFAAMSVLYMFVKASNVNKAIEKDCFEEIDFAEWHYTIGVLNGFSVSKLIDFKLHKNSIVPTYCDAMLTSHLRDALIKVMDVVPEKNSKSLSDSIAWTDEKYA